MPEKRSLKMRLLGWLLPKNPLDLLAAPKEPDSFWAKKRYRFKRWVAKKILPKEAVIAEKSDEVIDDQSGPPKSFWQRAHKTLYKWTIKPLKSALKESLQVLFYISLLFIVAPIVITVLPFYFLYQYVKNPIKHRKKALTVIGVILALPFIVAAIPFILLGFFIYKIYGHAKVWQLGRLLLKPIDISLIRKSKKNPLIPLEDSVTLLEKDLNIKKLIDKIQHYKKNPAQYAEKIFKTLKNHPHDKHSQTLFIKLLLLTNALEKTLGPTIADPIKAKASLQTNEGAKSLINNLESIALFFKLITPNQDANANTIKIFEFLYTFLLQEKTRQLIFKPNPEAPNRVRNVWDILLGHKKTPIIQIPIKETPPAKLSPPDINIQHWLSKNIQTEAQLNAHQQNINAAQNQETLEDSTQAQNTLYTNQSVTFENENQTTRNLSLDTSKPRIFISNKIAEKQKRKTGPSFLREKTDSPIFMEFSLEFYHDPEDIGLLNPFLKKLSDAFSAWLKTAKTTDGQPIYAYLIQVGEDRHSWVHLSTKKSASQIQPHMLYDGILAAQECTVTSLPIKIGNTLEKFTHPFGGDGFFRKNHNPLLSSLAIASTLNQPSLKEDSCSLDEEKQILLSLSENFYLCVLQNDPSCLEPLFDNMADILLHPSKETPLEAKPFFYEHIQEVDFYDAPPKTPKHTTNDRDTKKRTLEKSKKDKTIQKKTAFVPCLHTNYPVKKQKGSIVGNFSNSMQQIWGTSQLAQSITNSTVNFLDEKFDILSKHFKKVCAKINPLDKRKRMTHKLREVSLWIENKADADLIEQNIAIALEDLISTNHIETFNEYFFFKTKSPEQLIKATLQQRLLGWKRYTENEWSWLEASLKGTVNAEKNPRYLNDFEKFCEHFDHFINATRRCKTPLPALSEPIQLEALGKIANLLLDTPESFRDEQLAVLVGHWDFLPTLSTDEALPLFNAARQLGYSILHPLMDLHDIFENKNKKTLYHYNDLEQSGENLKRDYYRFASLTAVKAEEFSQFMKQFDETKAPAELIAALGRKPEDPVSTQVRSDAKIEILGVLTTLWNFEDPLKPKEHKPIIKPKKSFLQQLLSVFKRRPKYKAPTIQELSLEDLRRLATDTLIKLKFYTKKSQTPGAFDIDGTDFNDKKSLCEQKLGALEKELQKRMDAGMGIDKGIASVRTQFQQYNSIRAQTAEYCGWSLEALQARALDLKKKISTLEEQLDYLSLVFAVQYHLSRGAITPRPEQILAVLKILSGNNLLEIATGEGKSNIMLWVACVLAASNQTIDALTPSEPYAVRDANNPNTQALSKALGLTVRHAWQVDSATADILFVDISNNVIFDNQAQVGLGGPRALPNGGIRKKEAVLIDEADLLRPIMATTTSIIPHDGITGISRQPFLELYQAVHDVVRSITPETRPLKISKAWIKAKALIKLGNNHPAAAWMNETNQWEDLIRATFVAWKRLKKDRDYTISYEPQPDGQIKPFVRIMHYDNSGALDKHSHFAHFVHQAIVAHEQRELPAEHKDKEIDLPEPQLTLSQGDIYHHLQSYEGSVNAISGTIGEDDALAHLESFLNLKKGKDGDEERPLTTTHLPKSVTDRRYDFTPLMCPNREAHYKELIKALFDAKEQGRSALVVFKTLQEIKDFEQALQANQLDYQIYDDTFNPQDKRPSATLIINSAKEPGAITLTTGIGGRAADFKDINLVLMAAQGDPRYEGQGLGRGGRQGDFAITQTIYNQEECQQPALVFTAQQKTLEKTITKQADDNRLKQAARYALETKFIAELATKKTPDEKTHCRNVWAKAYQSFNEDKGPEESQRVWTNFI